MGGNILEDKKHIFFLSFFLYNLSRVLPHAVLTVILLSKGMSVGDIAVIQSFFMLAGILFEFPSGILTDIWSEKIMYIISLLLLGISYYTIMVSSSFILLCMSWFIYGISSASMSNSLDMYFLRSYENDEKKIKQFNISFNNINLYSTLIGGGIGSFIYEYMNNTIYFISIVLLIISGIIILMSFHNINEKNVQKNNIKNLINELKLIFKNKNILINIVLMAFFQIILQIFFQFWQVILIRINIDKKYFGIFYLLFQIIAIFSNYLFKKIKWQRYNLLLVLLITTFFSFTNIISNKMIFIIVLILFLIPFNIYNNQLTISIQKEAPSNAISSIMSLTGTFCNVVSIFSLWIIGIMDKLYSFKIITLSFITIFGIISVALLYIQNKNINKLILRRNK